MHKHFYTGICISIWNFLFSFDLARGQPNKFLSKFLLIVELSYFMRFVLSGIFVQSKLFIAFQIVIGMVDKLLHNKFK